MMHPYPTIEVPGDTLIQMAASFRSLLREVEELACTEEACGCSSYRNIKFARTILQVLDGLLTTAEARQEMERLLAELTCLDANETE